MDQKTTKQSPISGHLAHQPVPPPEPQTGLAKPASRQVHQPDLKEHRKEDANLLSLNKELCFRISESNFCFIPSEIQL